MPLPQSLPPSRGKVPSEARRMRVGSGMAELPRRAGPCPAPTKKETAPRFAVGAALAAVLTREQREALARKYSFNHWADLEDGRSVVRFCTSWATTPQAVEELCRDIHAICGQA